MLPIMQKYNDLHNGNQKILAKTIFNVCHLLDISEDQLAIILGIDILKISQANEKPTIELTYKEAELALLLIRITIKLSNLTNGDVDWINYFMKSHNHLTGGTPIKQIQNRDGLIKVLTFLEKLNK